MPSLSRDRSQVFWQICNDSLGDVVQSDETKILYGKDWFEEKVLGLTFKISPFSFFQTNTSGAEVLYQRAREYVLGEINVGDAGETGNGNMAENTPGEEIHRAVMRLTKKHQVAMLQKHIQ